MSSNEELQSTTEELETANEELQSANEELTTLNEELQNRNDQLAQSNNDILNLLGSVNLSMVLLDPDLRIRRFTPTAQKVLNIASTDLGRPLTDIQLPVAIPDLKRHIVETMNTLKPMQAEVQGKDGRWYALQVHAYITEKKQMEGAVLALTDISELTQRTADLAIASERLRGEQTKRAGAEEALHVGETYFRIVADSLPELICYIDAEGRYQFNNKAYEKLYGIPVQELKGRLFREAIGEEGYATIQPVH